MGFHLGGLFPPSSAFRPFGTPPVPDNCASPRPGAPPAPTPAPAAGSILERPEQRPDSDSDRDERSAAGGAQRPEGTRAQQRRRQAARATQELRHAPRNMFLPRLTFQNENELQAFLDARLSRYTQSIWHTHFNNHVNSALLPLNVCLRVGSKLTMFLLLAYPTSRELERRFRLSHSVYGKIWDAFLPLLDGFSAAYVNCISRTHITTTQKKEGHKSKQV